jgi:serine protease Do
VQLGTKKQDNVHGVVLMFGQSPTPRPRRALTARRLALLATTIAALGVGAFAAQPNGLSGLITPAFAQNQSAEAAQQARPVGFADIVEKVKPAVVSVRVKIGASSQREQLGFNNKNNDDDNNDSAGPNENNGPAPNSPLDRFFRQFGDRNGAPSQRNPRGGGGRNFSMAQGSGFFISADGYVVTNNHVVDHAQSVEVTLDDGKSYTAKVVGTDPKTDIALLKVEGRSDFPYVKFSETQPRIGDWVLAVGNPFGLGGTVTAGILSARGRDIGAGAYDDFLQIDAPVNKGNSGGPTFDVSGGVIGVNTAIFSPSGGSVGIGFAIPADTVKSVVAQLKDKGSVTRGWIGVQIQTVTPEIAESLGLKQAQGALVAEPQADSPAQKAGIVAGDVITAVNGDPVKDARDLAKKIGSASPGTSVKLTVVRGGAEKTLTLTLGELPRERQASNDDAQQRDLPNSGMPHLGLTLAPAKNSGGEGVLVTAVDPDGPAAEHGFSAGDLILDVSGKTVSTPADVRKAFSDARTQGKRTVLLRVKSGNALKFVALPVGRA